jgi:hypothetical protein
MLGTQLMVDITMWDTTILLMGIPIPITLRIHITNSM